MRTPGVLEAVVPRLIVEPDFQERFFRGDPEALVGYDLTSTDGKRLNTFTRTIDTLLESGLVVERDFGEGFRRFEPARDVPHHEHLVCTQCGRVEEFRDERLERMTTIVAESRGFARQRHRLVIHGVCRDCQTRGTR